MSKMVDEHVACWLIGIMIDELDYEHDQEHDGTDSLCGQKTKFQS